MDTFGTVTIKPPGTLKVGSDVATEINEIIAGTVSFDLPSCSPGAVVSASAIYNGLTSSHNVVGNFSGWAANEPVSINGIACGADLIQVSCTNPSGAAINPTSQFFSFFAWK